MTTSKLVMEMPKVYIHTCINYILIYQSPPSPSFSCATEELCTVTRQGAYLKSEMMRLHFSCTLFERLVTYMGKSYVITKATHSDRLVVWTHKSYFITCN